MSLENDYTMLKKFISMKSMDKDSIGNKLALTFIYNHLKHMGFSINIAEKDKTDQPVIVAHRLGNKSNKKIIIYGHYDIVPTCNYENWISQSPFELEEIDGRFYGRGIADNKGPLIARLQAVNELIALSKPIPEILWLIQGEEEISHGTPVANTVFKDEIKNFRGSVFIEETGFNDLTHNEEIAFLWSPILTEENLQSYHLLLNTTLNFPRIEYRTLNKFNRFCPFLSNLPDNAIYIGFGPNDQYHNIHKVNESLNKNKMDRHKYVFADFLTNYASYK